MKDWLYWASYSSLALGLWMMYGLKIGLAIILILSGIIGLYEYTKISPRER